MPFSMRDLVTSMLNTPTDTINGQYAGHNVAIVSKEYVNLSFRFGYHYNVIDAYCDELARNNHIYFRFLGGATDLTKRSRRALLIGNIMKELDFTVRLKGDMVIARVGNMVRPEMEKLLEIIGRLIGFTRQLDIRMESDATVNRYKEAFLAGDYAIMNEGC